MKLQQVRVHSVKFSINPYGGWYAKFLDNAGHEVGEKYYPGWPRWWFKVVAWRVLRKSPLLDGATYVRGES